MPTDLPWRERARASWRVTEDLPTPPLPDSTCDGRLLVLGFEICCLAIAVAAVHLPLCPHAFVIDKLFGDGQGVLLEACSYRE